MNWQPIETAPKDGTPVIVGIAGLKNSVGEAYWWQGEDGRGGWQTWDGANHTRTVYTTLPTHWMPFPDEPNVEVGGGRSTSAGMTGSERTWHDVVVECERILGCPDTAESPLMSNLPNLVRDLKHGNVLNAELSGGEAVRSDDLLAQFGPKLTPHQLVDFSEAEGS